MLSVLLLHTTCSDYLDVVPDGTATLHHSFKKRVQAEAYLYGIYSFLPKFGLPANNPAFLAGEETWLFPEFNRFNISAWKIAAGGQSTQSPLCNFWASKGSSYVNNLNGGSPIFTGINDCNVFLENIRYAIDLGDWERELWIAEVKVLKAFFHYWLLQMYGPVPIVDDNIDVGSSSEGTMQYREPVDEVVKYIVSLIEEAEANLPLIVDNPIEDLGRITLPMALALKAKILTLAASPLFNGNPEYLDVVDGRGVKLFPQSYDPAKWEKAATALKAAIDVCKEAGHALFDMKKVPEVADRVSNETLLSLQTKGAATESWNPEIIWGDISTDAVAIQSFGLHAFIYYHIPNAAWRSWSPTLATVKQFYTKNGVPIEEDNDWTGVDLYALRTADNSQQYYIAPNYKTVNLHFNREPRFYGAVAFDGGKMYLSGDDFGAPSDRSMQTIDLKYVANSVQWNNDQHTTTGYLVKKMVHWRSVLNMRVGTTSKFRYSFPVIRLADLFLLYAEVLNETKVNPDNEVYAYIDSVRTRSGLKGVVDSWLLHSNDPDKPSRKDGMREIIHRERMIELAFEGQRYWDLRRWKLLKSYMNRPIEGWNVLGRTTEEFYNLQTVAEPKFEEKDYLWPIRQENLLKNKNLIQNPGWK